MVDRVNAMYILVLIGFIYAVPEPATLLICGALIILLLKYPMVGGGGEHGEEEA